MGRWLTVLAAAAALAAAWPAAAAADGIAVNVRGPASPTNDSTPTFTFTSDDPAALYACRIDTADGAPINAPAPCIPSEGYTTPHLDDGAYVFTADASNLATGATGEGTWKFTVDTVPPDAPAVSGTPAGFTFSSEANASFVCRLDGPAGPGADASCASGQAYTGLAPGDYTFLVQAVDAAGNAGPAASLAFSVAAPPVATATPVPLPAPPVPRLHATIVARPGLADVRIRLPGSAGFVRLTADRALPVGALVDARRGSVQLLSAPARGTRLQRATFHGAVFRVTQPGAQTLLTLAPSGCRAVRLSGEGHGAFAVRGRFSTASIRGARWVVQDSCSSTLTRVFEGVAAVRDTVRHRTRLVRAGRTYLAHSRD